MFIYTLAKCHGDFATICVNVLLLNMLSKSWRISLSNKHWLINFSVLEDILSRNKLIIPLHEV